MFRTTILKKKDVLTNLLALLNSKMIVFVHDAIPALFPEFSNPGDGDKHLSRLQTVTELASKIIVNSQTTADQIFEATGCGDLLKERIRVNALWVEDAFLDRLEYEEVVTVVGERKLGDDTRPVGEQRQQALTEFGIGEPGSQPGCVRTTAVERCGLDRAGQLT